MDQNLAARLAALPRLSREAAVAAAIPCKICRRPAGFFDVVDVQKCVGGYPFGPSGINTYWHRCDYCDFLFTSFFDDWSHAEFSQFIYNDDYVLMDPDYVSARPQAMARMFAEHYLAGHQAARILDYGSGLGVFATSMAQLGFPHVASYDPFSMPVRPIGKFDVITCSEVIEHSPFPLRTLADMRSILADEGYIVLSETLQPPDIARLRCNWWYAAPRNGHVSTFTDRTFAIMADQCGLIFHRGEGSPHALRTPAAGSLAEIALRCGASFASCRLGAPEQVTAGGWSGVEDAAPWRFRWTTSRTTSWRVTLPEWPPGQLKVTVPFAHESRSGFAAECVIEVNGQAADMRVDDHVLVTEIGLVDAGEAVLTLRTPELLRSGDREVGLALLIT
jgi:SAM-dependent methyltransferase